MGCPVTWGTQLATATRVIIFNIAFPQWGGFLLFSRKWMRGLHAFFWVIPGHLNFICWRFGTHCRHTNFRCWGITQKKAYNSQNTVKVWNQVWEVCLPCSIPSLPPASSCYVAWSQSPFWCYSSGNGIFWRGFWYLEFDLMLLFTDDVRSWPGQWCSFFPASVDLITRTYDAVHSPSLQSQIHREAAVSHETLVAT
jgi:hypothetical protein